MDSVEKARQTQIRNIEAKTGKSVAELIGFIQSSSLTKHTELVKMVKEKLSLGHGDANTLVHLAKQAAEPVKSSGCDPVEDAVTAIYSGKNEALRPVHDAVMKRLDELGEFEISPKKKNLSLRRKKQFATVGPGTKGRLEIGLNMRGIDGTARLESLPAGGMCQYRIYLTQPSEVDDELMAWIQTAYEAAG